MRSFYANDLVVQGFEMRSLATISNPEKDMAKKMFRLHRDSVLLDTTGFFMNVLNGPKGSYVGALNVRTEDSSAFYKKKLHEPDSVISHQIILSDSVGFAVDSTIAGFYFPDSLEVSYKWKMVPPRYRALSKKYKHETIPVSEFVFVNKTPVYIVRNGFYYKPYDLKITGYWAWIENVSTWLPYDYYPGKTN